jgi:hypothetical protein
VGEEEEEDGVRDPEAVEAAADDGAEDVFVPVEQPAAQAHQATVPSSSERRPTAAGSAAGGFSRIGGRVAMTDSSDVRACGSRPVSAAAAAAAEKRTARRAGPTPRRLRTRTINEKRTPAR